MNMNLMPLLYSDGAVVLTVSSRSLAAGEDPLPGGALPEGRPRGQRHPQDQRGSDPHGVPL